MRKRDEWKEKVHAGLEEAIGAGLDVPEIARHADVTAKSLYAFLDKKTLGPENKRKLAMWLRAEGFLPPEFLIMEAMAPYGDKIDTPPDVEWLAGQELINLGLLLQSAATADWKLEKYEAFIKHAFAHLKSFRAQLEKGRK